MKAGQGCIGMTCCPGDTICLASLRLRYPRCRSAQVAHRVWPGMGRLRQLTQIPSSLAVRLCSRAFSRWYSLRSGRWARFRSYSRRSCFGTSGSLGLGVIGFLVVRLGLDLRGLSPVLFVAFGPRRVFLGSAKVCSSVILLEYCAGSLFGHFLTSWFRLLGSVGVSCLQPTYSASPGSATNRREASFG